MADAIEGIYPLANRLLLFQAMKILWEFGGNR